MLVKLRLSGNLKMILPDWREETHIELDKPTTVNLLLARLNISPLTIMTVIVNGKNQRLDYLIQGDSEVILIGPIAGG